MLPTHRTDVLIIGAGGAALRAALEARAEGRDVLVLSKGVAGKGGTTPTALTGYQAAFGHADARDNPDIHYADTMANGQYLSNPAQARILAEEAPGSVLDLERMGVPFQKTEDGRFVQKRLDESQSYPRSVRIGDSLGGPIMRVLRREALRAGATLRSDVFVSKILVRDGEARGAVGIDLATGEVTAFMAGAVILATGGAAELFSLSTCPPEATGDGYMLGFDAGARIIDPEFFLFLGHALLGPPAARGVLYPFQYLLWLGAKPLYNALGESFVANYSLDGSGNPSRDVYARAIFLENRAGRGSTLGGAYFDPASLPMDVLERELPSQTRFLRELGLSMRSPIEVGVAGHFLCGGLEVDEDTRTAVPGLFAAGEVAGGLHGAARIGGNALAELFVFGKRAGRQAAGWSARQPGGRAAEAANARPGPEDMPEARREKERLLSLLHASGDLRPGPVKRRLQELMSAHAGVIRSGKGLETALDGIRELQSLLPRVAPVHKGSVFNLEWTDRLELEAMLGMAGIVALAALRREESRGSHYREDFPARSAARHTNTIVSPGPGGPVLTARPAAAAHPGDTA